MAKKVVIFGNTNMSKMIFYDAAGRSDFEIACFTVDKDYMDCSEFMGLPLVDFAIVTDLYPPEEYDMLAVLSGYSRMRDKEKLYLRAKGKGYRMRNYISSRVDITPDVTMGDNNIILAMAHIGIGGIMGDNNMIRQNVYLGHDFVMGSNNVIGPGCTLGGNCVIKNTCYFGLGATVLDHMVIEEETLVGAGSVIIKNTEPYSKIVGNPGRIIGNHKEEGIKLV